MLFKLLNCFEEPFCSFVLEYILISFPHHFKDSTDTHLSFYCSMPFLFGVEKKEDGIVKLIKYCIQFCFVILNQSKNRNILICGVFKDIRIQTQVDKNKVSRRNYIFKAKRNDEFKSIIDKDIFVC